MRCFIHQDTDVKAELAEDPADENCIEVRISCPKCREEDNPQWFRIKSYEFLSATRTRAPRDHERFLIEKERGGMHIPDINENARSKQTNPAKYRAEMMSDVNSMDKEQFMMKYYINYEVVVENIRRKTNLNWARSRMRKAEEWYGQMREAGRKDDLS